MKSRFILFTAAIIILMILFVGCSKRPTISKQTTSPKTGQTGKTVSMVSTVADFEKAISNEGTWCIAITKNLTINKNLILNGDYKSGKKDATGKAILERKIDLYGQDEDKSRLTLTVPKLTVNSPQTSIEYGTFKGNIYVSSNNFHLIKTIVKGNVYFTTDEARSTFKMDSTSIVSGKRELKK